jgi:hypothetical protein
VPLKLSGKDLVDMSCRNGFVARGDRNLVEIRDDDSRSINSLDCRSALGDWEPRPTKRDTFRLRAVTEPVRLFASSRDSNPKEDAVNRMYLSLGTATLMAITIATAGAKDKPSEAFLKKAIEGNFAEVSMGDLAQKNGQSDGVKSFGKIQ